MMHDIYNVKQITVVYSYYVMDHYGAFNALYQDLTSNMLRLSLFFATPSLKHNTAPCTPNYNVPSLTKTFLCILVQKTEFTRALRL